MRANALLYGGATLVAVILFTPLGAASSLGAPILLTAPYHHSQMLPDNSVTNTGCSTGSIHGTYYNRSSGTAHSSSSADSPICNQRTAVSLGSYVYARAFDWLEFEFSNAPTGHDTITFNLTISWTMSYNLTSATCNWTGTASFFDCGTSVITKVSVTPALTHVNGQAKITGYSMTGAFGRTAQASWEEHCHNRCYNDSTPVNLTVHGSQTLSMSVSGFLSSTHRYIALLYLDQSTRTEADHTGGCTMVGGFARGSTSETVIVNSVSVS